MDALASLRERVYRANLRLQELGLVTATFGNASGIDRDSGTVFIKPSGVGYESLSPQNMVPVSLEGRVLESGLNPSSDTKTHLRLYRAFPEIGGVVHTHSRFATAWAQARRPLPCFGTTHADVFYGEVPCTAVMRDEQIRRDYEEETAVQILETFARLDYRSLPGVLVACHGPFTWGSDPGAGRVPQPDAGGGGPHRPVLPGADSPPAGHQARASWTSTTCGSTARTPTTGRRTAGIDPARVRQDRQAVLHPGLRRHALRRIPTTLSCARG